MKNSSYLLTVILTCLWSLKLPAQTIKFYTEEDAKRHHELTMMERNGQTIELIDGVVKIIVTDSSYLHTNYPEDSIRKLMNKIPLYRYSRATANPEFTTYKELISNKRKDTITHLSISNKSLKRLPVLAILQCKNLKEIEIINTQVSKLPWLLNWKVFKLDSLKSLSIYNYDSERAFKFSRNKSIELLTYKDNPEAPQPKNIFKLENLKKLDLMRNDFKKDAQFNLNQFNQLNEVNLSHNAIKIENLATANQDSLSRLILSFCKLTAVPDAINNFKNLKELQLAENNIQAKNISSKISDLKTLELLSFYKNNLESLPPYLLHFPKLIELDLNYNSIQIIPAELGRLTMLERLYLAENKIYSIPKEIGELKHLKELYIKHNRISYLPNTICELTNITDFHVNNNYLQGFPECILSYKNLRDLDLSFNEIKSIPIGILELPDLKLLWMRGITFEASSKKEAMLIKNTIERLQEKGVKVSVDLE